jgi:hypothetical protein
VSIWHEDNMPKQTIKLFDDDIVIVIEERDGKYSGSVEQCPDNARAEAAAFMALCHACNGLDVTTQAYRDGLEAFMHAEDNPEGDMPRSARVPYNGGD